MKTPIYIKRALIGILMFFIMGVGLTNTAGALFKRMPTFQAIKTVVLENIYKLHDFTSNSNYASYGSLRVIYPEEVMLSNQDYSIHCNPTGDTEATPVWYDFRRRGAEDLPEVSLDLELNTIYTCQGLIRTDEALGTRLYTHHGDEFQTMICHEDPLESGSYVFGEDKTRCLTGAKSVAIDSSRRVAFRPGYVGQHAEDGWWYTDPEGNVLNSWDFDSYAEKLAYCKKFWADTVLVVDPANPNPYRQWYQEIHINPPTIYETLHNWYGDKNLRRPSSMNVQTYECETTWYHWEYNDWSTCQCDGNRYRTVECLDNLDNLVNDSFCDPTTEPIRMESCSRPASCFNWNEAGYGSCQCDTFKYMTYNCRNFGMDQLLGTTPVVGVPTITGTVPTIVSESICTGFNKIKPIKTESCLWSQMPSGCFSWHHTGYEACQCDGTKTRIYECVNDSTGTVVDDIYCVATKPSGIDTCTIPQSCYTWVDHGFAACDCTETQSKIYLCENTGTVVADYFCSYVTKPVTTQACTAPGSCYDWVFNNTYETCTCIPQQKQKVYVCQNTTTGSTVSDTYCSSAGAKPVLYSSCTQAELPAICFCDATDWNPAPDCSTGCYTTNYNTYGPKTPTGNTCLGTAGQPVNNCNNAQQCCSTSDCGVGQICSSNLCIPQYHRYYCNDGSWGQTHTNYFTSTTNCTGTKIHGSVAYCLTTPSGNCCTANYNQSCVSGHYSGQTYNCDGVCSGGTPCSNPPNSTWTSADGCSAWSCNAGYVQVGGNCLPQYHKYTCGSNGYWTLTTANYSTTSSNCTTTNQASGSIAYCSSTPSNTYCCVSTEGDSCLSGHYTGQTYSCSGACTGGTACTKPAYSVWTSVNGCDWTCSTGYVLSNGSCIPKYHRYLCTNGNWTLTDYNYRYFALSCSTNKTEGGYAYCLSTPTGTCTPPACSASSWNPPDCSACSLVSSTEYGTKKPEYSNCTGTIGQPSAVCPADECCSSSDCPGAFNFCINRNCVF